MKFIEFYTKIIQKVKNKFYSYSNNLAMNEHDETQDNQSLIKQEEFQQLRKKIALSSADFIQLTYSQEKFNARLQQFNQQACLCIQDNKFPQAAIYLDEAQKILQYAAGCGKTIQRTLITTVLNNQACLLQHISEFQQSANYLEAIIFNISDFVEGSPTPTLHPNLLNCQSTEYAEIATYFERKESLALYHLRFCALTSYSKNNQLALKSAKKALQVLKSLCEEEYAYQSYISKQQSRLTESQSKDQGKINSIFKQLSRLKEVQDCQDQIFQSYLSKALQYIKQYQRKIAKKKNQGNQSQENSFLMMSRNNFESYSIGNLMQASTQQIEVRPKHKEFMEKEFSKVGRIYRALHMSMAYFTVATELRLISAAKYSLDEDERRSSQQFKESKIYHLISVILIAKYLQCRSVFFEHTISSIKNHYSINLHEMAKDYIQDDCLKPIPIMKSDSRISCKEAINNQQPNQQQNKTTYIHNNKHTQIIQGQNMIKAQQLNPRGIKIVQINSKQCDTRIKNIKSKSRKLLPTQSSRAIDTERLMTNHSRNKENFSKNKLQMRSKDTMRSRKKNIQPQTKIVNDEVRRGIYYGCTNKSRSISNKKNMIQNKIGKKIINSRILIEGKRGKNQKNIQQQYGVKSAGAFTPKLIDVKHKKLIFFKAIPGSEQNQYSLKISKSGNDQLQIKKIKSPRNIKKDLSKKKRVSKDKATY